MANELEAAFLNDMLSSLRVADCEVRFGTSCY